MLNYLVCIWHAIEEVWCFQMFAALIRSRFLQHRQHPRILLEISIQEILVGTRSTKKKINMKYENLTAVFAAVLLSLKFLIRIGVKYRLFNAATSYSASTSSFEVCFNICERDCPSSPAPPITADCTNDSSMKRYFPFFKWVSSDREMSFGQRGVVWSVYFL